ncbi:hypothetical protein PR202_gb03189 [Eleusine coracana subsp. coracana]|uniref:Uncharacterized protein n=1 Tax=Eleusine coracana subsp. coracana TaxID=191504 RepID=A0AAV5E285_ELECO|nr:hypothetical protein PR202_gb03189 [Eleusine coracana subsp. coracana]
MLGVTASCLMGALEPLLGKLSDILGNEFIKLKDNCCEISFLLDELSTMKIALEKMSEQEEADPLGRQWMSQLQELAYDAEDVIDTFILHPSNISTSSGMIKKVLNKFTNLKAEYQFAGQIKQLKERTLEVSDRRKRYKMDHVASPKYIPLDPRLPALFEEPGSLVGIESQINDIVKWITDANSLYSQSSVLSIVGFGGLGKTTLANLVFKKVSGDFECTAFVAASRSPDILIILRHILLQVCQGDNLSTTDQFAKMLEDPQKDCQMKNLRYTELVNAIREYLQDKRYILAFSYSAAIQIIFEISAVIEPFWNNVTNEVLHIRKITFPEDYKIEVERLKKRWIAEGFVSERKGQCMEDTAESYIIELVNTNMMQPMDIEYDGKPAACQLHDIICLPQWINLSELTTLQIGVQHFKVEDMEVLEGLPALLILNIDAEEAIEEMHTGSLEIAHLSSLKELSVHINCQGSNAGEVEVAEAAIRSEVARLPNHLTTHIIKR